MKVSGNLAAALLVLVALMSLARTGKSAGAEATAAMTHRDFGKTSDGKSATLYTLTNKHGMSVAITDFGASVVSISVPDNKGHIGDVVLGYDDAGGYEAGKESFGATVGRYANRIAHGSFSIDGQEYTLFKNNGENTLHGGKVGFNKKWWEAKDVSTKAAPALQLEYLSKDGEEGFPGNLSVRVTFTLKDDNALQISYRATTDKKTVLNLTNHSYFNLAGSGTILDESLMIAASKFTPVDPGMIPTGEARPVAGTPLDFLTPKVVGDRIDSGYDQLKLGRGYDHNWILDANSQPGGKLTLAATVSDPRSGTARKSAKAARTTRNAPRCASKPSTIRIRQIIRSSPPRNCFPARPLRPKQFSGFPRNRPEGYRIDFRETLDDRFLGSGSRIPDRGTRRPALALRPCGRSPGRTPGVDEPARHGAFLHGQHRGMRDLRAAGAW
jgi:aldose 1-epimerase